jgi:hypothetical protein
MDKSLKTKDNISCHTFQTSIYIYICICVYEKVGGGKCHHGDECGSHEKRGKCNNHKCVCSPHYTGPSCKAHAGQDDINWEQEDPLSFVPPEFPMSLIGSFVAVIAIAISTFVIYLRKVRSSSSSSSSSSSVPLRSHQLCSLVIILLNSNILFLFISPNNQPTLTDPNSQQNVQ